VIKLAFENWVRRVILRGTSGNEIDVNTDGGLKTSQAGTITKDYWEGSANITKTFASNRSGLVISNDGSSNLTALVNGMTFTLKPTEVLEERFEPFTQVVITTTSAYRAWARA
jgi:hypothetical protein